MILIKWFEHSAVRPHSTAIGHRNPFPDLCFVKSMGTFFVMVHIKVKALGKSRDINKKEASEATTICTYLIVKK